MVNTSRSDKGLYLVGEVITRSINPLFSSAIIVRYVSGRDNWAIFETSRTEQIPLSTSARYIFACEPFKPRAINVSELVFMAIY